MPGRGSSVRIELHSTDRVPQSDGRLTRGQLHIFYGRGRDERRGAHLALRIDQKIPRGDDSLASGQAARYGDEITVSSSKNHGARFEHPVTGFHVDNFLQTAVNRSEEHTSELQSPCNLVCRLL